MWVSFGFIGIMIIFFFKSKNSEKIRKESSMLASDRIEITFEMLVYF